MPAASCGGQAFLPESSALILDALELVLDFIERWRFFLPIAIGGGTGLGVYYAAGQTPDAAVAGFAFLISGIVGGTIWEVRHSQR